MTGPRNKRRYSKTRLALDMWGDGKPIGMIMFAHQVAISANEVYECCQMVRKGSIHRVLRESCSQSEWLSMYRSHKAMQSAIVDVFIPHEENLPIESIAPVSEWVEAAIESQELYDQAIQSKNDSEMWLKFLNHSIEQSRKMYESHLKSIRQEIKTGGSYNWIDMDAAFRIPEIVFFFKVWFPCWILFQECPQFKYRRACKGNVNDIEELIQLDNTVFYDERINRHFKAAKTQCKKSIVAKIQNALDTPPKNHFSKVSLKYAIGALIYRMCNDAVPVFQHGKKCFMKAGINYPIGNPQVSYREVIELFNAVAEDFHGEGLDTDFPAREKSYEETLRKYAGLWPVNLWPPIKLPDTVGGIPL